MNGSRSSREGAILFPAGERMPGWSEDNQGIFREGRRDNVEVVRNLTHDVEIVEVLPHALEDMFAVDHFERELDFGMGAAEIADQPCGEIARRGDHRELQAAALETLHLRQLHAEQIQSLQHVAAGPGHSPTRFGEKKLLSGLLVQRQPKTLRQLLDLDAKAEGVTCISSAARVMFMCRASEAKRRSWWRVTWRSDILQS